ncbi:MAG: phosphoenolpyruvate--protein phosphotransferase [Gemmatimonadetes bacterium]|nr:MAG: phosphoenolpyruvate--protein phosphotransferase [Gemmatimonadetes bacterium 13_1_40CM_4_69_5]OLC96439.1 MAG: phosphoenolpyruvate--protein phosphotransferase [Gemmatimonadetes bacterium 13_1_40CM_3_70_6]OLE60734.1 MAG: phosphoenolpyruvate--protein phosphotransferase [Gemmatimonadetes bacterium 13_1_20CM_2_70_10]PYO38782.1 MAG: phosphoenolpyruvate--protein phosphotransferase [Gemmatimonadota bacterium]
MSERLLKGIGVSPGIAIGPAVIVRSGLPEVPHRVVSRTQVEKEVRRLRAAVRDVKRHIAELKARAEDRAGPDQARIFDAQVLMLEDREFLSGIANLIRENHLTAEKAFEFKVLEVRDLWAASRSARLKERLADLNGLAIRMIQHLMHRGDEELERISRPSILVAREIGPGLTVQFDREQVIALVSEEGTKTSHAAILAHSMGMPAVMGLPSAVERIAAGAMLVVDGSQGTVLLDPTAEEIAAAQGRDARRRELDLQMEAVVDQPAVTTDGQRIVLRGNVDLPDEIAEAQEHRAEGVGLLRTEFLITSHASLPTEDEQAAYFRRVGEAFPGHPVVVRTYDLGGDKFPAAFRAAPEANPFLGWRAIRVCLDQPDVFCTQIRAALRAAAHVNIQLMIPLVTRLEEVDVTREMVAHEAERLARAGIEAAKTVPVGVMVETPAAAVMADRLAEVADFLSVGTNDLTQYTLVVDRGNARLADRFTPHDPSVLRLLKLVANAARAAGKPASVCGEMASEPVSAFLLLGLGYETLSVAPPALPLLKWVIRQVSLAAARSAADAALAARSASLALDIVRYALADTVDLQLIDPDAPLPAVRRKATLNR